MHDGYGIVEPNRIRTVRKISHKSDNKRAVEKQTQFCFSFFFFAMCALKTKVASR